MKKITTLLVVLSFVFIAGTAMASEGPSILNSMDQAMYQTMSDNQLSETIGESFTFKLQYSKLAGGTVTLYTYTDANLFGDVAVTSKYDLNPLAITPGFSWSWSWDTGLTN